MFKIDAAANFERLYEKKPGSSFLNGSLGSVICATRRG